MNDSNISHMNDNNISHQMFTVVVPRYVVKALTAPIGFSSHIFYNLNGYLNKNHGDQSKNFD